MPSLMVIDEEAVPSVSWETREPRLKRQELASELKHGADIAGVLQSKSRTGSEREDPIMAFSAKQLQALTAPSQSPQYQNS